MLTGLPPFYSKHINVMYQKILNAQLTFPQSMSDDARSLLEGLLTRDPAKRLGGEAIRKHPFFKGLDWEKLEARDIEAPWKPPVKNDTDITQIDEYFTQERPSDSPVEGALMDELDDDDKDMFEGFTFAGKAGVLEESD
jgi:serum/glucocorticoid-regulated kinase 2